MDVQKFRDSRQTDLDDFKKQYNFLKTEYSSVLSSAINETDPAKQQELIQQVLSINTSMADGLREIIGKLNQGTQGFDPKELNDLTKDLIQYQKDYAEIEQSQDRVNTLKLIQKGTKTKLETAMTMYNLYIAILVVLAFVAAYLVFRTEWVRTAISTIPTTLSQ